MNEELDTLPVELHDGDLITRYVEWGDMAVRYARVPAGTDFGPVLEGIPGDRCPSPHWGIVLEGSITLVHAPREVMQATGVAFLTRRCAIQLPQPAGRRGRAG